MKTFTASQKVERFLFSLLEDIVRIVDYPNEKLGVRGSIFKKATLIFLDVSPYFPMLPKKFRAFARGTVELLVRHDTHLAIYHFRVAASLGFPQLDILMLGLARLELNLRNYESARMLLFFVYALEPKNANVNYNLALLLLVSDNVEEAKLFLMRSIALDRRFAMAHQNLAARYDRESWKPTKLDLIADADLHLYDAFHMIGQMLIGAGDSSVGIKMCGAAMKLQQQLAKRYELPFHLVSALHDKDGFDPKKPIRILPYEWVTQIGHLGLIDVLLKMQRLGMRPDVNWVLLAPPNKVINKVFLDCLKPYLVIVQEKKMINALFPYQRICGEQFNCYLTADGSVIDWCDAAAQAFIEWDQQGRGSLLSIPVSIRDLGKRHLEALGVPNDAWFVALHARSSGFYGEGFSFTQKHRNAPLKTYLPAIKYITKKGGWVIRMGDPSMPPLKYMPKVVDLAHNPYRAQALDVYLWSQARLFLGTTSGPANVAVSFHTTTLLVNCVSNYAQSWNSRVMFIIKPFWSSTEGRFLKMREVFAPDFRCKIFNQRALIREGVFPISNTAKEILAATEEILEQLDTGGLPKMQDPGPLKDAGFPLWLWGNAHPSKRFFEMRRNVLID